MCNGFNFFISKEKFWYQSTTTISALGHASCWVVWNLTIERCLCWNSRSFKSRIKAHNTYLPRLTCNCTRLMRFFSLDKAFAPVKMKIDNVISSSFIISFASYLSTAPKKEASSTLCRECLNALSVSRRFDANTDITHHPCRMQSITQFVAP